MGSHGVNDLQRQELWNYLKLQGRSSGDAGTVVGRRLRCLRGGGRRYPMANTHKAGCACGAVQIEITGDPTVQAYCHCSSCRGWLGAPIHAASLWPMPSVKVTKGADKLGLYKRTENSHRQFCTACGLDPGLHLSADPARALRREGDGGARRAAEVQGLSEGVRRIGRHARRVAPRASRLPAATRVRIRSPTAA